MSKFYVLQMSNDSTSSSLTDSRMLCGCEVSDVRGAAYGLRVRLAQGNGFALRGFPCGRWKQTGA